MKRFALLALPMMLFASSALLPQEPVGKPRDDSVDAIVIGEVKNILDVRCERHADDPRNELYVVSFMLEMTVKAVEQGTAAKVGDVITVSGRRISKTPQPLSLFRSQVYRAYRVPVKCGRAFIVRDDSEIDMSLPAMEKRVQEALARLAKGELDAKDFSVTYNDLNPFHGGLRLTIHGDGKVEQEAARQQVGEARKITADDVKGLVKLLNKHEAWEQRTSHRQVIEPGESTAVLVLRYKLDTVQMWEYHSQLVKNDRLIAIREAMKSTAWKKVS